METLKLNESKSEDLELTRKKESQLFSIEEEYEKEKFDKIEGNAKTTLPNLKIKKDICKSQIFHQKSLNINQFHFSDKKKVCKKSNEQNGNEIIEENNNDNDYIRIIYSQLIDKNSLIERKQSMPNIAYKNIDENENIVISSIPTFKKSNITELNNLNELLGLDIDEINEEENDVKNRITIFNINENLQDKMGENENKKKEEEQIQQPLRPINLIKEKEKDSLYFEEKENERNIKYNNSNNKIQFISPDLLLKKIIFEDFLKKQADNILHFCQQCFCFIKKDIFFDKILNCFKYYRKQNIQIEKIANLIEFFNVLIIEMFEYYKIIPKDDLQLIKNIYNNIVSDLMIDSYNNENEIIKERKELINQNLYNNADKDRVNFNGKLEIENNFFMDKDYIIIENDKQNNEFGLNIYNEKKDLNEFLYLTFLKDFYESSKININQNLYGFSVISPSEKLLINLKEFLYLFNSKKPSNDQIMIAKNRISFYTYLKEKNYFIKKNYNINNSNQFLRRSQCITINPDKNIIHRKHLLKGYFSILDWKIEEIGDQLINNTNKSLKKIEKRELYKAIYLKKDKEMTSPNVIQNINNFNKLTLFIIEDIISYDHASDRAKIIDKWVQVAEYCKKKKDYNDCIAINSALNNYIITGLNLTFKELKSKTNNLMKSIEKFCLCNGNYKFIREEIKSLNKNAIFYPYLGMMLRDINFLEESSKYLVDGKLINFEKIENVHKIMENNFRFKYNENKNKINNIQELNFFEYLEFNTEENLESIANKIEPKFAFNNGKKEFKRPTKIDEKYFEKYSNKYIRKSTNIHPNFISKLNINIQPNFLSKINIFKK